VEATPSQTVGPFFSFGLCVRETHRLVADDAPGAVRVHGCVLDGADAAVPDAVVEVWQADARGGHPAGFGWGRCGTGPDGEYAFTTVRPGAKHAAPHLTLLVFARGLLKPVLTRMYFPGEPANADDPVLAGLPEEERGTLVGEPDGAAVRFDVRLQGDRQTVFFAL
jgi:protocatechuate 3,4-dioxygenase, alpha subunit